MRRNTLPQGDGGPLPAFAVIPWTTGWIVPARPRGVMALNLSLRSLNDEHPGRTCITHCLTRLMENELAVFSAPPVVGDRASAEKLEIVV